MVGWEDGNIWEVFLDSVLWFEELLLFLSMRKCLCVLRLKDIVYQRDTKTFSLFCFFYE